MRKTDIYIFHFPVKLFLCVPVHLVETVILIQNLKIIPVGKQCRGNACMNTAHHSVQLRGNVPLVYLRHMLLRHVYNNGIAQNSVISPCNGSYGRTDILYPFSVCDLDFARRLLMRLYRLIYCRKQYLSAIVVHVF